MKNVIFADSDCDGLTSARQVQNYLQSKYSDSDFNTNIILSKWNEFGIPEETINEINSYNADTVYVLDLGSDIECLQAITKIRTKNIVVIDNHPPRETDQKYNEWKSFKENLPSNIYLDTTVESCTAGEVWEYLNNKDFHTPENDLWALIGLEGDVAINKKLGKQTADKIFSNLPFLRGNILSGYMSGNTWNKTERPILSLFSQLLNVGGRIAYDEGNATTFRSMEEIEIIEVPALLPILQNSIPKTGLPNIQQVLSWYQEWHGERTKKTGWWFAVLAANKSDHYTFDEFGISIVNHHWNVGSAVCNSKGREEQRAWFTINLGTPRINHISGRLGSHKNSPEIQEEISNKGHIGHIFQELKQMTHGDISGGGIKEAGSANYTKDLNTWTVINKLAQSAYNVIQKDEYNSK